MTAIHLSADAELRRPRIPLNWWGLTVRFLLAVVTLLGMNLLSSLVFLPLVLVFEQQDNVLFVLQFVRYVVVLMGVVVIVGVWMRLIERRRLRDAGWVVNWRGMGWLAVGVGVSVAVLGVLFVARLVAGVPIFVRSDDYAEILGATPLWAVILIWFGTAFFLQGIPEELLWRGWLFTIVRDRPRLAFWWTTLSFAAIHLVSEGGQEQWFEHVSYLLIPLGFGALAGAFVLLTGSMWMAAGVHAGFHVGSYLIVLLTGEVPAPGALTHAVVGISYLIPTALVLLRWRARTRASVIKRLPADGTRSTPPESG